ncbi:MAG: helix-turn-helix domain-containing protein [Treponema sp.]|nr:helix-turn-helix domain-containing protein [Treponema sp.]
MDLRAILSRNIKNARGTLHITQAQLAECADISLSYVIDIERCRTWVSDKTLRNLARALNREAYELLIPLEQESTLAPDKKKRVVEQIAALINAEKAALKKNLDESMEDMLRQIVHLYAE